MIHQTMTIDLPSDASRELRYRVPTQAEILSLRAQQSLWLDMPQAPGWLRAWQKLPVEERPELTAEQSAELSRYGADVSTVNADHAERGLVWLAKVLDPADVEWLTYEVPCHTVSQILATVLASREVPPAVLGKFGVRQPS